MKPKDKAPSQKARWGPIHYTLLHPRDFALMAGETLPSPEDEGDIIPDPFGEDDERQAAGSAP